MDELEASTSINGKSVSVVLVFDYPEAKYKKDFEEFVKYHKKPDDKEWKQYLWKIKYIPYDEYRQVLIREFSKCIFDMLSRHQGLIVSERFTLQVLIRRVPERSFYFSYRENGSIKYSDSASGVSQACFYGAGIWFLQAVVVPFKFTGQVERILIEEYFLHELTHHADSFNNTLAYTKNFEKKVIEYAHAEFRKSFSVIYIYNSMANLREEGLAEFRAKLSAPTQEISQEGILKYNNNLHKLAQEGNHKKAKSFYEKRIGYENMTPSGEYEVGRAMCLTIAMAKARDMNRNFIIVAGGRRYLSSNVDFAKVLSSNKRLKIEGIYHEALSSAFDDISKTTYEYFVGLYERACSILGIPEQFQAMTRMRFQRLLIEAEKNTNKELADTLAREGFDPSKA